MLLTALFNAVCSHSAFFATIFLKVFFHFALDFCIVIIYTNALWFHALSLGY